MSKIPTYDEMRDELLGRIERLNEQNRDLKAQLADREARLAVDRSWLRRASLFMKEASPLGTTAYLVAKTEGEKERIRVFNEQFSELQYYIDCHLRDVEPRIYSNPAPIDLPTALSLAGWEIAATANEWGYVVIRRKEADDVATD